MSGWECPRHRGAQLKLNGGDLWCLECHGPCLDAVRQVGATPRDGAHRSMQEALDKAADRLMDELRAAGYQPTGLLISAVADEAVPNAASVVLGFDQRGDLTHFLAQLLGVVAADDGIKVEIHSRL